MKNKTERKRKKKLEEIKRILRENKSDLKERFKVKNIGIFGSYVKSEQKKRSDIDILVEFEEPISLIEFVALERHLSELIGKKVDLVMKSALKPRIGAHILKEVISI
ncbi:MAG: nucleotidyltransferase family protein [Candidatus Thermoplasmatota archaeon]